MNIREKSHRYCEEIQWSQNKINETEFLNGFEY